MDTYSAQNAASYELVCKVDLCKDAWRLIGKDKQETRNRLEASIVVPKPSTGVSSSIVPCDCTVQRMSKGCPSTNISPRGGREEKAPVRLRRDSLLDCQSGKRFSTRL